MTRLRVPEMEEGGSRKAKVFDTNTKELLIEILTTLKKIEYHLYLATDTELKDQDV